MPFNSSRNGYQNESIFVYSIHNKKICELEYCLQLFIIDLFGNIDRSKIVECYKNDNKI